MTDPTIAGPVRRIRVRRSAALAALLMPVVFGLLELSGLGAARVAHAQFTGCPLTGSWIGGPLASYRWSFREEASGALSGAASLVGGLPSEAVLGISGSRSGAVVAFSGQIAGSVFAHTGTMTDCDTIEMQVIGFSFTLTRVSASYCGSGGAPDPGEECDDGNFENGDLCTVACTDAACGNHVTEPDAGEACDDGNLVQVDGCSNACQPNTCGNGGPPESGEQCDDGNQVNGDGCSRVCEPNVCGNGVLESGEQCDDHLPPIDGDGCSSLCQFEGCDMSGTWRDSFMNGLWFIGEDASQNLAGSYFSTPDPAAQRRITSGNRSGSAVVLVAGSLGLSGEMTSCNTVELSPPGAPAGLLALTRLATSYCGDGNQDAGEQCDEGDFDNGDLCTSLCTHATCGNRIAEPEAGEECDDGNLVQADGCSNGCLANHCGDGSNPPEPGEECDDHNLIDGDGCSATCQRNTCGNGIIEPGEQCDDGGLPPTGGDGCSDLCQFEGCSVTGAWRVQTIFEEAMRLVEAPDGTITGFYGTASRTTPSFSIAGSRIGNTVSLQIPSDGSLATLNATQAGCGELAGQVLPTGGGSLPFTAERLSSGDCGDGIRTGDEQCDDGNTTGDDDCNFLCRLPHCGSGGPLDPYEACDDGNDNPNDGCTNDCQPNVCGDGILHQGVEECDDGNAVSTDACKADCTLNVCGDGVQLDGIEACDDDDLDPNDGCDATCNVEELQVAALPAAGGTVTTDPENDGATPDDPIETAITVPPTGTSAVVSVAETTATVPTSGYQALGKQVSITAPTTTPESPLLFVFALDASVIPPGEDETTIVIFRNGTPVPECPGASQAVPFDPCVTARALLADGDVRLTVLTSRASAWTLAARRDPPDAAQAACRKQIRTQVTTLAKKRLGELARCNDLVRKGRATGPCPDAAAVARIARAEAKVDPAKLAKSCPAPVVASLGLARSCSAASDPAGLAACIVSEVAAATDALAAVEYATPSRAIEDKADRTCQAAIATEAGKKFAAKRLRLFDACNGKLDQEKVLACLDPASSAQLAGAELKLAAGIAKRCTDESILALGTFGGDCAGASTVAALSSCQLAEHVEATDGLLSIVP